MSAILLNRSFDVIREIICLDLNSIDSFDMFGWTALMYAVQSGEIEIVRYILEQNVDVNATTNAKETALHLSCLYNSIDIAIMLLDFGKIVTSYFLFSYCLQALIRVCWMLSAIPLVNILQTKKISACLSPKCAMCLKYALFTTACPVADPIIY